MKVETVSEPKIELRATRLYTKSKYQCIFKEFDCLTYFPYVSLYKHVNQGIGKVYAHLI